MAKQTLPPNTRPQAAVYAYSLTYKKKKNKHEIVPLNLLFHNQKKLKLPSIMPNHNFHTLASHYHAMHDELSAIMTITARPKASLCLYPNTYQRGTLASMLWPWPNW